MEYVFTAYAEWLIISFSDFFFLDIFLLQKMNRRMQIPGTYGHLDYGLKNWLKKLAIPEHFLGWPFFIAPLMSAVQAGICAGFEEVRDTAFETGELEAEARQLNGEMNVAAKLIQKCIGENARVAQNQGEYAKRYDALVERFETAKAQQEEVQATITEKQAQRKMMENFMEELRGLPEQVDYFDEGAWCTMVNFVTVYGKDDVRFTFKNGMEIKV